MFFKNYAENKVRRLVPDLFLFFIKALCKLKASGQHLHFNIFWKTSTWTYNRNKLYKIDPNPEIQTVGRKICLIFIFYKRIWDQLPHYILGMIFQEKHDFSFYILLTDKSLFSGCLYFLRYWAICVL